MTSEPVRPQPTLTFATTIQNWHEKAEKGFIRKSEKAFFAAVQLIKTALSEIPIHLIYVKKCTTITLRSSILTHVNFFTIYVDKQIRK